MLTLARAPYVVDMVFAEAQAAEMGGMDSSQSLQWDDLRQTHKCNFLDDIDFG